MSAAKAAILRTARAKMRDGRLALRASPVSGTKNQLLDYMRFADLVVMAGGKAPDPIPNSAVKRPSADGTSSQDAGE